jgi:hypothetical protein
VKKRPLLFTILSLIYAGIALSIPMQISYIYGHSLSEWQAIVHKVSLFNWVVITISLANAYLSFQAHPWLKVGIPLAVVAVAINNTLVATLGVDFSFASTTISTLLFMLFSGSIYSFRVSRVLSHPSLRWWKIPVRHRQTRAVLVESSDGERLETSLETFDISTSGLFATSSIKSDLDQLEPGAKIKITIPGSHGNILECHSRVVRKSDASGEYPAGIGLEFHNISWWQSLKLNYHNQECAT